MTDPISEPTLTVEGVTPFAQIPVWILRSGKDLSSGAIHLYGVIMSFADNKTKAAFPSRETLAEAMGVSVASVKRYVRELEQYKALEVQRRRNRRTGNFYANHYVLRFNSPWVTYDPRRGVTDDPVTRPTTTTTPTTSSLRSPSNSVQGTSLRSPSLSKRRTLHALAKDFATAPTPDDREAAAAVFAEQFENETGLDADFDLKGWSDTLDRDVRKHGLDYGVGKFISTYTNTQKSA